MGNCCTIMKSRYRSTTISPGNFETDPEHKTAAEKVDKNERIQCWSPIIIAGSENDQKAELMRDKIDRKNNLKIEEISTEDANKKSIVRNSSFKVSQNIEKNMRNGRKMKKEGKLQESLVLFNKCLKIKSSEPYHAMILSELGTICFELKDHMKAVEHFENMLKVATNSGETNGIKAAHHNLGTVFDILEDHQNAARHYEEKVQISNEIGDFRDLELTFCDLGDVYCSMESFELAADRFSKALDIAKETNGVEGNTEIKTYNEKLADLYFNTQDYDKAIYHLNEVMIIAKEAGDLREIYNTSKSLGNAHHMKKDYEAAETHFKESLIVAKNMGSVKDRLTAHENLGFAYQMSKKFKKAQHHRRKGIELSNRLASKLSGLSEPTR